MTRISWALLCLLFTYTTKVASQCSVDTTFSDVIFLIDNSSSITMAEYAQFEQTILATANKVQGNCPQANIGIMHYGGLFGRETSIEYPLSGTNSFTQIERQFCTTPMCNQGGDDLNAAIGSMIDSIDSGRFMRDTSRSLSLVIFTDAFAGLSCDPMNFPNCSQVTPYTNIDRLKSAPYNAQVTVVGATEQAAANLLSVYASPGGSFDNVALDPACSTTVDGCDMPRKYIPTEFGDPTGPVSDSIVACVDCQIKLLVPLSISAGNDVTVCANLNESTTLTASVLSGAAPFSFSWDNGLGAGASHTVTPSTTTTFTVTITDANGCVMMDSVTVTADSCTVPCDPLQNLSITGDQTVCSNLGESTTLTASFQFATHPVSYSWTHTASTDSAVVVTPSVTTTFYATGTDANGCSVSDSITVTAIVCTPCDAYAGTPQPMEELCLINNRAILATSNNNGMVRPSGYELVYLLTDKNLTVVDYRLGSGSFQVNQPGIYRIHTLIAETSNRNSPDFLDLSLIERGRSDLFLIVNCITDHDICADFDYTGRVHRVLGPTDMMCMPVENSIALCSDGIDNDRDGLVDCADDDCKDKTVCLESSLVACNDLYDNDGDGLTDCYDPDCWQFKRCFEKEEKCNDGIDNDGDGLVDCADESCKNAGACQENSPFTCVDGRDNDGDGLTDCADPKCQKYIVCAEYDADKCSDGIDNDYDGLVDCADSDCQALYAGTCAPGESTLALCHDGIDNDGDGLIDCMDKDCGFVTLQSLVPLEDHIKTLDPTCPRNDNGEIALVGPLASGYQYSIDGGAKQSEPIFKNLSPGLHEITIYTLTDCDITTTISLTGDDCTEICNDGKDNDGDGLTDCADPDCGVSDLEAEIVVTKSECPQEDNGSIAINTTKSGVNYKFSIDGGRSYTTSKIFSNLSSGEYHVIAITDAGCLSSSFVTVEAVDCSEVCDDNIDNDGDGLTDCADPDCGISSLADSIMVTHASCPFNDNGQIVVGGQLSGVGYTYSISGSDSLQASSTFSNVDSGIYLLIVRTDAGCEYRETITITGDDCSEVCDDDIDNDGDGLTDCADPDCGIAQIADGLIVRQPQCPFTDNGMIAFSGQLDGVDYTYSINDGQSFTSVDSFSQLVPGTYNIAVRTSAGCEYVSQIVLQDRDCSEVCDDGIDNDGDGLTDCDDPDCGLTGFADDIVVLAPQCPFNDNGGIEINGQLSGISYEYSLNNGISFSRESEFMGLQAGTYDLMIRTGSQCRYVQQIVLPKADCSEVCDDNIDNDGDGLTDCEDPDCGISTMTDSIGYSYPTCPSKADGAIRVYGQVAGVQYRYSIDGGQRFGDNSQFTGLVPGVDTLVVIANEQCRLERQIELLEPDCTEICGDGIDNDGDGLTDCDDPHCGVTGFSDDIIVSDMTCAERGSIIINGQYSGAAYEYSLNGGRNFQSSNVFSDIAAGDYDLMVRTSEGCTYEQEVTIGAATNCVEICDNNIDDDGDGLVDCADGDCGSTINADIQTADECTDNSDGTISVLAAADIIAVRLTVRDTLFAISDAGTTPCWPDNNSGESANVSLIAWTFSGAGCGLGCVDLKGYINFDWDRIPHGAVINSASLEFQAYRFDENRSPCQGASTEVNMKRITSPWQESEITHNNIPSIDPEVAFMIPSQCDLSTKTKIDVRSMLNETLNMRETSYGYEMSLVNPNCYNGYYFKSREGGQPIHIVVEYSVERSVQNGVARFDSLTAGSYSLEMIPTNGCNSVHNIVVGKSYCQEICDNNIDDDGDGLVDCADGDCAIDNPILDMDLSCNDGAGELTVFKNPQESADFTLTYVDSLSVVEAYRHLPCSPRDILTDSSRVPPLDETTLFLISWTQSGLGCTLGCNSPTSYIDFEWDKIPSNAVISSAELTYKIKAHDPNRGTCHGGSTEIRLRRVTSKWDRYHTTAKGTPSTSVGDQVIIPSYCENIGQVSVDITQLIQNAAANDALYGLEMIMNETECYKGYDVLPTDVKLYVSYTIQPDEETSSTIKYTGLSAGGYALVATNDHGCQTGGIFGVQDCSDECALLPEPVVISATCPTNDNGAVIHSGSVDSLEFSVDGVTYQELGLFDNLAAGEHYLYARHTNNGCIDSIAFTVGGEAGCNGSSSHAGTTQMSLSVALQGPYDPESGIMSTSLNDLGYLPGDQPTTFFGESPDAGQPYNEAPWFYSGKEGTSKSTTKSGRDMYEDDVVDWILVSLRSDVTRESTVWMGAALLHSDGYVELKKEIDIPNRADEYYIVIEHRNHLPVMTPRPVPIIDGEMAFDFTAEDAYKSIIGVGQKMMPDGRFAMIAGNGEMITELSSEVDINARDFNMWLQENGANSSYFQQDYDMNGDINVRDRILWENNNGLFSSMPNRK